MDLIEKLEHLEKVKAPRSLCVLARATQLSLIRTHLHSELPEATIRLVDSLSDRLHGAYMSRDFTHIAFAMKLASEIVGRYIQTSHTDSNPEGNGIK